MHRPSLWVGISAIAEADDRKMLFWKAKQLGAVPAPGSTVAHRGQATVWFDVQAHGVIQNFAVIEHTRRLQFGEKCFSPDLRGVKIFIPLQKVAHRSMHGSIA